MSIDNLPFENEVGECKDCWESLHPLELEEGGDLCFDCLLSDLETRRKNLQDTLDYATSTYDREFKQGLPCLASRQVITGLTPIIMVLDEEILRLEVLIQQRDGLDVLKNGFADINN